MTAAASPATVWEGRPVAYWQELWRLPELLVYERIGSTNDVARERAAAGAPAGTVVIAEAQSAGRGRFGRRWDASPRSSLLLSCVLRPRTVRDPAPGTAPLRVGLAAAAAIDILAGIVVGLKWPNDLVAPGAGKLGGILCEAVSAGTAWCVVAGVGINIRQHAEDWPAELRGKATSLDHIAGAPVDRATLASALLAALRPLFDAPLARLTAAELADFARRDVLAGNAVVTEETAAATADDAAPVGERTARSEPLRGMGAGIAPDGALLLRTRTGERRVTTGTVRLTGHTDDASTTRRYP